MSSQKSVVDMQEQFLQVVTYVSAFAVFKNECTNSLLHQVWKGSKGHTTQRNLQLVLLLAESPPNLSQCASDLQCRA